MEHTAASLLALLMCAPLHAQEKVGKYGMAHTQQKTFDILATERGAVYLDCPALNDPATVGGIIVDGADIEAFRSTLAKARDRYAEWAKAAADAGAASLPEKRMEHISPKIDCYFYHDGGRIDSFSKKMAFKFKVEDGKALLIGFTGPVSSPDVPSVKFTGMSLVFSSVEEIDAFLAAIDPKRIEAHFSGK